MTRKGFSSAFANPAIDLQNEDLGAALADASLDVGRLDALDGKVDGRVSGQHALDDLYDEINRLDTHTTALSSRQERAVLGALGRATIAPKETTADQGQALAAAARQLVAEDKPPSGKPSQWALKGAAICENPALSSPRYAGKDAWKCNVFVGEAFHRAGLPFPINGESHYVSAKNLPSQSGFFQPVGKLDDVRPGDLISIHRNVGSGHVEIVTGVDRAPDGHVFAITSVGAHEEGSREGNSIATPLVNAARTTVQIGDDTYRVLRPMVPPTSGTGK